MGRSPRFWAQPLAWMSLSLMFGSWSWIWLQPRWVDCAIGILVLLGLTMIRSGFPSCIPLVVAGFLLGWMAPGIRQIESMGPPASREVMQVIDRIGGYRLLESTSGRRLLRFSGTGPPVGRDVVVWWEPEALPVPIPGEWSMEGYRLRAGAVSGRARDWLALGAEPARAPSVPNGRHQALLSSLLLGDTDDIDPSMEALFRRTGTRHMMAVSGLHLGLVSGLVGFLTGGLVRTFSWCTGGGTWRLPRLMGCLAASWVTAIYGDAVGWPVSARRAWIMVLVASVAACSHRRPASWSSLGLAASAIALLMPWQIVRPGFLLSFGAVAGILGSTPTFARWISPDWSRPLRWSLRSLAISVGATLGTLPTTAWIFQEFSWVGPFSNLLVGPLLGICILPLGLAAVYSGGDFSRICLRGAEFGVDAMLCILELLDSPLWHPSVGPIGASCMAVGLVLSRRPSLLIASAWLPNLWPRTPTTELVMMFLAIGQGDATLMNWPDGRLWLVDGGPPSSRVLYWLRRERIEHIDLVVLTHPDLDHLGGLLPVFESMTVEELWVSRSPEPNERDFRRLMSMAATQGTRVLVGDRIRHPWIRQASPECSNDNECGLILDVKYGRHRFLLTGDIGFETEEALLHEFGQTTVLKVSHHGSNYATSASFLDVVSPEICVISVGIRNTYGHPGLRTLGRLSQCSVWRTDRDGNIKISSNGNDLRLFSDRPTRWASH